MQTLFLKRLISKNILKEKPKTSEKSNLKLVRILVLRAVYRPSKAL